MEHLHGCRLITTSGQETPQLLPTLVLGRRSLSGLQVLRSPLCGDGGGEIVGVGTPEDIAANPRSHTGAFLKDVMKRRLQRQAAE